MDRAALTDLYFMDARSRLIDLAAFLDRVERSPGADDHRLRAFRRALAQLAARSEDDASHPAASPPDQPTTTPRPSRAEDVLLVFSDPTSEPAAHAGSKAATGAWLEDAAK